MHISPAPRPLLAQPRLKTRLPRHPTMHTACICASAPSLSCIVQRVSDKVPLAVASILLVSEGLAESGMVSVQIGQAPVCAVRASRDSEARNRTSEAVQSQKLQHHKCHASV
eukprot:2776022-Rhodomonas_salina.4